MTLIETIIRMFVFLGLSYPFWRNRDVNAKIASQQDIRKKSLMKIAWIHILLYSAIIQFWVIHPVMSGMLG